MGTEMLRWWYAKGWGMVGSGLLRKLARATDFFSLKLLLRTLFEPFKQISNRSVDGSLEARFRAFIDRLISRIVGTVVRLGLLIIGLILIVIEAVLGIALLIAWPVVPLMPIASIILTVVGLNG